MKKPLKKKVIHIINGKDKFEEELNAIEGEFTQSSFFVDSKGNNHYFAILFYKE